MFQTLRRCIEFVPFSGKIDKKHLQYVLLNEDENEEVEVCVKHLAELDSVTLEIMQHL